MKRYRHRWLIIVILGVSAWLDIGLGFAQTEVIPHIDPITFLPVLDGAGNPVPPTISILDPTNNDADVTRDWLPEPNKSVKIVVPSDGSMTVASIDREFDPAKASDPTDPANRSLTTSAYPGSCTNYGSDTTADFDFDVDDNVLTPSDQGGMAVVRVTLTSGAKHLFIIPQDSDFDGIPDNYETKYGPPSGSGSLERDDDEEQGPAANNKLGDGFSALDEYRGFRTSGQYVRGDPTRKDFFIHLHENPECIETASLTDSNGLPVSLTTFFADPAQLFVNMNTLIPEMEVHRIKGDENEWVDYFSDCASDGTVTLAGGTPAELRRDRQVNKNAIIPLGPTDPTTGRRVMKGVRLIECLDLQVFNPLGEANKAPPDGFDADDGRAIIYTQRIVQSFLGMVASGQPRQIKYYTFEGNKWVEQGKPFPAAPEVGNQGFVALMEIALPFYAAHETAGHSLDLTPTEEGTRNQSYGYHHAEGTGTNIDIRIVHKVDNRIRNGFNKLLIPRFFADFDKRDMRLLSAQ